MTAMIDTAARIHALLALYRESHYDVELARGGVATMRIGRLPPAALVRWLGSADVAYYLTACNPHSQSLPQKENDLRLEGLRAYVKSRAFPYLEGAGHIPGEAWREQCLLIRDIAEDDVAALVRQHEQNSIVVLRAGAPTVLRLYRPDWREIVGDAPDLEWA
ncbi:MAG TPA: DUF3293 domain-containing protein [Rhodanobacteraceae bacterium]|nr:DUF3293 domain-containing protein [Rhodanobacteraceae bacterium]